MTSGYASKWILLALVSSGLMMLGCGDDDSGGSGQHVKVFVTTSQYDGNFGGAGNANAACNNLADAAGLSVSRWTAWLSDDNFAAIDKIFRATVPYRLVDEAQTKIADDIVDLTNGSLDAPINVDETGATVTTELQVWTATDADGTNAGVGSCVNWTSDSNTERAQVGLANSTTATWSDSGVQPECDTLHRLYCFADAVSN